MASLPLLRMILVLPLLLLSCGREIAPRYIPTDLTTQLEAEIDRITPLLKYDQFNLPIEEPYPGASSGDAMSMNGRIMLDSRGTVGSFDSVKLSIAEDGRPYRNPLQVGDPLATFSRDALMGLIEASVGVGDRSLLYRVRDFYRLHDDTMCGNAKDNRCDVTASMDLLMREAMGWEISFLDRGVDETTILAEALGTPPTYQNYLVMRKLRLHIHLGFLTSGYRQSIKVLYERFPRHLYVRYLLAIATDGNIDGVARDLLVCMKTWEKPGEDWWGSYFDGCPANPQGHELVSFAKLLIQQ